MHHKAIPVQSKLFCHVLQRFVDLSAYKVHLNASWEKQTAEDRGIVPGNETKTQMRPSAKSFFLFCFVLFWGSFWWQAFLNFMLLTKWKIFPCSRLMLLLDLAMYINNRVGMNNRIVFPFMILASDDYERRQQWQKDCCAVFKFTVMLLFWLVLQIH